MKCPECNGCQVIKIDTRSMKDGRVYRRCRCKVCGHLFTTIECYIPDGEMPNPNMFRRTANVDWRGKYD